MLSKRVLVAISGLLAASCVGEGLPPSVWPPPNFRLVVEELSREGRSAHVVRRFQVNAEGTVIYGTSSQPLVDSGTGASWPVFDRLSVYRLEPKCVRALARRLDRAGIGELVVPAAGAESGSGVGLVVRWRAFEERRDLPSSGRLRGLMADIMAIVSAHLPDGESFEIEQSKPVVTVLRGVPVPVEDAAGALAAYREQLNADPGDEDVLLATYALACSVGERAEAERLLAQWIELKAGESSSGFEDSQSWPSLIASSTVSFSSSSIFSPRPLFSPWPSTADFIEWR